MRKSIYNLVKLISKTFPLPDPIYEFGSFQVKGQESIPSLRELFKGKTYVGCDMRNGTGVDVILDLHNIELPDYSVGTVLALDTLEHVEYPHKAMQEIFRILRPDGVVIISSVMNFPIHDHPQDFWRFTPDGFKSLLKDFSRIWVGWSGDPLFPHTVVGIGFKNTSPEFNNFLKDYKKWLKSPYMKGTIAQFIPPILLTYFRIIRNKFNP